MVVDWIAARFALIGTRRRRARAGDGHAPSQFQPLQPCKVSVAVQFAARDLRAIFSAPENQNANPVGLAFWSCKALAVTYSRMRKHTTIGAGSFHFRVREGIGWYQTAMAARETLESRYGARTRRCDLGCERKFGTVASTCN